ncbi:MAG: energy transducer TonB family protein [Verrucomicrobiales bacterium]
MKHPVLRALLVSLLLHFVVIAGIEAGRSLGLWKQSAIPEWMKAELAKQNAAIDQQKESQTSPDQQAQAEEPPLLFVDVDASQAEEKPPEDTKYYAVANTRAANAEKKIDSNLPNIPGTQERVPKVLDTAKPPPEELKPLPKPVETPPPAPQPKPKPAPDKSEEDTAPEPEDPKPPQQEGETMLARAIPKSERRPDDSRPIQEAKPRVEMPPPKPDRPRTLAEAKQRKGLIEGKAMKQEGGAGRIAADSSVDARLTPFSSYDAALIAAVQARWDNLLDEAQMVRKQAGKVVVEFRLHKDGRVTNLNVAESEVSETLSWLCQRAVLDPNPYAPFPSDLRRMLRTDYREVRFTFYYSN